MTKVTVAFRSFVNTPKIFCVISSFCSLYVLSSASSTFCMLVINFYANSLEEKAGNVYISPVSVNFLAVRLPPWKPGVHYRVHRSKPFASYR